MVCYCNKNGRPIPPVTSYKDAGTATVCEGKETCSQTENDDKMRSYDCFVYNMLSSQGPNRHSSKSKSEDLKTIDKSLAVISEKLSVIEQRLSSQQWKLEEHDALLQKFQIKNANTNSFDPDLLSNVTDAELKFCKKEFQFCGPSNRY